MPNENLVRNSLVKAYNHPRGLIAMVVRKKVAKALPPELQRPDVIQAVITFGAWAAQYDNIWDFVYAVGTHYQPE